MLLFPEYIKDSSDEQEVARLLQQTAFNGLQKAFIAFDERFKAVWQIYFTGKLPNLNYDFQLISALIKPDADLFGQVKRYAETLAYIHQWQVWISSDTLVSEFRAFLKMIRHCANQMQWDLFDTLELMTNDCLYFVSHERECHSTTAEFTQRLNSKVDEILGFTSTNIRAAVMGRENAIKNNYAHPLPDPDCDYRDDQVVKLPPAKRKRYHRWSATVLRHIASIWNHYRFDYDTINVKKGRKISKADVYFHTRNELNGLGIESAEDFRLAIGNARKQFPDIFHKRRR